MAHRMVTITAIRCGYPGQNKPSALEKVERLEKLEMIGAKISDGSIEKVGNGQMSLMSEVNTNDCNQ